MAAFQMPWLCAGSSPHGRKIKGLQSSRVYSSHAAAKLTIPKFSRRKEFIERFAHKSLCWMSDFSGGKQRLFTIWCYSLYLLVIMAKSAASELLLLVLVRPSSAFSMGTRARACSSIALTLSGQQTHQIPRPHTRLGIISWTCWCSAAYARCSVPCRIPFIARLKIQQTWEE